MIVLHQEMKLKMPEYKKVLERLEILTKISLGNWKMRRIDWIHWRPLMEKN